MLPVLTMYVNKDTNKGREVDYNTLIEEMKKYRDIKVAFFKDILKYYFKLTPAEF